MTMSRPAAVALFTAFLAIPAYAQSGDAPKVLLHGNYCGPGNNAPLAPVDALDAACARHDACTPDGGLASKACNRRLQADAEGVAQDPRQPPDLRALAGLVASGAAMMPSAPAHRAIAPVAVRPIAEVPALRSPDGADIDDSDENEATPE